MGRMGPGVTETQDTHLGRRTKNISLVWTKKKKKKIAFTRLLSLLNVLEIVVSGICGFLLKFQVTLIYFFHFVFAPRRLQSNTTQQLISSLWTEKLNRY